MIISIKCFGRELVWCDEFNGDSLDKTKWVMWVDKIRHDAENTEKAIIIRNGNLEIRPYSEGGKHFSMMITTEKMFEQAFGYFEVRAKLATESGAWSDCWLYNHDMLLDKGAEIDIFEHRFCNGLKKLLSHCVSQAIHFNGYSYKHENYASDSGIKENDFNIFGLEWTEKEYIFTINQVVSWRIDKGIVSAPRFIVLSVEIEDSPWAGIIPTKGYTGNSMMIVDYVRVYK